MKLERMNDSQIRCMLTAGDLEKRRLSLGELAYCTERASRLFHELIDQACDELDFDPGGHPVAIEAIPVSNDCLMLLITRVEDPPELDSRFARFTEPGDEDAQEDLTESVYRAEDGETSFPSGKVPDPFEEGSRIRTFSFQDVDAVCAYCSALPEGLQLGSMLLKDPVSGRILLVLTDTDSTPDYQCACALACDHAPLLQTGPDPLPFFREHYRILIREDALQVLGQI